MPLSRPTAFDAADRLGADPAAKTDSWWFSARLQSSDAVFWAKIHTVAVHGIVHSAVTLLEDPTGHSSAGEATEDPADVTLSVGSLAARTGILEFSGDPDELEIAGSTKSASLRLALRREEPVLYSGGSGLFPFLGGTTGQFAMPGLQTSGTVTVDGITHTVLGRTWFDRQWSTHQGSEPPRFTWIGLDLGAGRYMSVWDTAGDGTSWLTEVRADGTHTLADARRTDHGEGSTLTIPGLDASLEIVHAALPDSQEGFYAGAGEVRGTIAGRKTTGYAYIDVLG